MRYSGFCTRCETNVWSIYHIGAISFNIDRTLLSKTSPIGWSIHLKKGQSQDEEEISGQFRMLRQTTSS